MMENHVKLPQMKSPEPDARNKGIKRHPCLRPLSRDHLLALIGSQKLLKASRGEISLDEGLSAFARIWQDEITIHLADEEAILPQFIKEESDRARLFDDHKKLRAFAQKLGEKITDEKSAMVLAGEAGAFLDAHIRWEEREFFPRIEKTASPEEIERLLALTDEVESKRSRNRSCDSRIRSKRKNSI